MRSEHAVGLRELRHKTGDVIRRVRAGESLEITERGTPIARLVPVAEPAELSRLEQLVADGVLAPATHAGGGWPDPIPVEGLADSLSAAIEEDRAEHR